MNNIFLIGSTGSVGTKTLEVIKATPDKYKVVALSAHKNTELLLKQIAEFCPEFVVVTDRPSGEGLHGFMPSGTKLFVGEEHLKDVAALRRVDTVVAAGAGISSIEAVISALINRKKVALANKEVLVAAGQIITSIARNTSQTILPIDSEHSAIFQCLANNKACEVDRLILTASGGAFLHTPREELASMTAADALKHPTWSMGKKITIDSATMFNKGLEIIEASWLFDVSPEKIEVLIHPQSIVHSLVEFSDKNTLAVLSHPDMYLPISYALSYPFRTANAFKPLDLTAKPLEFFPPDTEKFPMLTLAREALEKGGLAPAVLNAANDTLVEMFLADKIGFLDIFSLASMAADKFDVSEIVTVENIKRITNEVSKFLKGE